MFPYSQSKGVGTIIKETVDNFNANNALKFA